MPKGKKVQEQEEEKELEERIASDPNNPVNYFELAHLLLCEKQSRWPSERTIDLYTKALALGLADPIQKGIAHHDLGCGCYDYPGNKGWWNPNIERYEAFIRNWNRKPTAQQVYHLEEAAREFNIALKFGPDDMKTAQRLAHIYGALGKGGKQGKMLALAEELKVRKSLQTAPPLATKEDIQDKTGLSFEEKCLKLLEKLGFTCQRTAITGDGGIDIVAISNEPLLKGTYIVQCKNWKNPVGEPPLRDLYGVVASENANKGILITSSTFTEAAQNFARGKNIELIDGDQLQQLIQN
jgi:Restriction endonuclease